MIKYNTHLGAKHLNMEARLIQEAFLQPRLKGMHCRHRAGKETEIKFREAISYGKLPSARVQYMAYDIIACCPEFKARIVEKLKK